MDWANLSRPCLLVLTFKNPWFKEGMRMPLTLDIWLCLIEPVTFSYRNIDTAWTLVSLWWNTVTLGVITTCPAYSRQNQTSYLFSLWYHLCFLESLFDLWIRSLAQKIMVPQRCHLAESKLIKRPSLLFFLFMGHILQHCSGGGAIMLLGMTIRQQNMFILVFFNFL